VAGETKVNVQRLKDIGTLIGQVVEEHRKPVTDLGTVNPIGGQFDAAEWFEALFADRRDAVVQHVKYLELACKEMSEGLIAIAKEFEGLDSTNADAMAKFTASAKGIITGMGSAEYPLVPVKAKTSYETGDDTATGDKDLFDFSDPAHRKVIIDPKGAPGMEGLMTFKAGKDDATTISLTQEPNATKGGKGEAVELTTPPPVVPKPAEPKPEREPKNPGWKSA
jgi:hypothetical protein